MSSSIIEPRIKGSKLKKLNQQQLTFVYELLADDTFNSTKAAKKSGYKNPAGTAWKLLRKPEIQAALGKAQRERMERCELKGDDVLEYLRDVLFFNPLLYFSPGPEGWTISDPSSLPERVGRLIDGLEVKHKVFDDGTEESTFKVTLVSKAVALGLAMKHCGVEKHEMTHKLDWDSFLSMTTTPLIENDPIEDKIRNI